MKRFALVLLILTVIGGSVFAFDLTSFPSPIKKGDILLSPALNIGSSGYSGGSNLSNHFSVGAAAQVDYAMGFPIAITFGGEVGFMTWTGSGKFMAIPILFRAAWHPNFEVANLDTYITLKAGVSIGMTDNDSGDPRKIGFAWGSNIGARYFFSGKMAVFGELGWDYYPVANYDYKVLGYSYDYSVYLYKWFSAGVTFIF